MKKTKIVLLLSILLYGISCQETEITPSAPHHPTEAGGKSLSLAEKRANFYYDLAFHHAPVHFQDVDRTGRYALGGKSDYITAIDFDGDLNSRNNWDNISSSSNTRAYGYYSVVETESHYYITYAFFHPRDWTDNSFAYYFDNHDNDLEGALIMVRKTSNRYGTAQGMITVFHNDFYSYVYPNSGLRSGHESVDGTLSLRNHNGIRRAETSQEAKGHGMKAYSKQKPGGNDYVIYYPGNTAERPTDIYDRNVKYQLRDIYRELWEKRFNANFLRDGKRFHTSVWTNGNADAPWNWDDGNDSNCGPCQRGKIATDPAGLFQRYFDGEGSPFSKRYLYNPYIGIE